MSRETNTSPRKADKKERKGVRVGWRLDGEGDRAANLSANLALAFHT